MLPDYPKGFTLVQSPCSLSSYFSHTFHVLNLKFVVFFLTTPMSSEYQSNMFGKRCYAEKAQMKEHARNYLKSSYCFSSCFVRIILAHSWV